MTTALILDSGINLLVLTLVEIVFGVDNLIFIALMSHKLPVAQQKIARRSGLLLALLMRIALLSMAYWLIHLTTPLFSIRWLHWSMDFSGRDLFLIIGGLFLLYKATNELHSEFKTAAEKEAAPAVRKKMGSVIIQIMILDIVFSLDSVITAVGMTSQFWIMVTAIVIAVIAMIFLSEPLAHFIEKHPTIRILAFSFLLMVGMVLVADGVGLHIPRGYVYFAIGFSMLVEILNLLLRGRHAKK